MFRVCHREMFADAYTTWTGFFYSSKGVLVLHARGPPRGLSSSFCPQGTFMLTCAFYVTPTWEAGWAAWHSSASCEAPGSVVWSTHRAAWWRERGHLCWTSGHTASETWGQKWDSWEVNISEQLITSCFLQLTHIQQTNSFSGSFHSALWLSKFIKSPCFIQSFMKVKPDFKLKSKTWYFCDTFSPHFLKYKTVWKAQLWMFGLQSITAVVTF